MKIQPDGSWQIYGRSNATMYRSGIRTGTIKFAERLKAFLVVDRSDVKGKSYLPLFVVLKDGVPFTDEFKEKIK